MRKLFSVGLAISCLAASGMGAWMTACSSTNNGTGFGPDGGGGHGGGGVTSNGPGGGGGTTTGVGGGGGTAAGGGGGSAVGPFNCAAPPDASSGPDSVCTTNPDAGACVECCIGNHETGYCVFLNSLYNDCCADCTSLCQTTFCANPPNQAGTSQACFDCLVNDTANNNNCGNGAAAACAADQDCTALLGGASSPGCVGSCPLPDAGGD
jgi:hypothetical protein